MQNTHTYWFFLGRKQDLAQAELEAVLPRFFTSFSFIPAKDGVLAVEVQVDGSQPDIEKLMSTLGGTVKIARLEFVEPLPTTTNITEKIVDNLVTSYKGEGQLTFSLSTHGQVPDEWDLETSTIKKSLRAQNISSRYIEAKDGELGAAVLSHHQVQEIQVFVEKEQVTVVKTLAVQDIDAWSFRDFSKPYSDARKGMLPPKLARIMVNLAIGPRNPQGLTVFDPFCGSGTVLMEAAVLGASVLGSDTDQAAIHGAGKNLQWLDQKTSIGVEVKGLRIGDATHVSEGDFVKDVDCVVTEPFLGKPSPKPHEVEGVAKGLEKLYLGTLKEWKRVLKPGTRIAMVLPQFTLGNRVKNFHNLIDRLESLGYTREKGPFQYDRPQTVVQREIYVFSVKE